MELKELEAALEGVLFAAGEPVGVERLCLGLEVDRATMDAVAQRLMDQYSYERRGIRLIKLDTSYQLCSAPEFAPYIRKTLESRKPARLAVPGRPLLFRTTKNFLRSFGLSSLEELPELPDSSQEGSQMTLELEAAVARLRAEEEQGAGLPAEDGP